LVRMYSYSSLFTFTWYSTSCLGLDWFLYWP